jgi:nicotinamide-nucleotide amidase
MMIETEIISIGSEFLDGSVADENGPRVAKTLSRRGFHIKRRTVVGDDQQDLEAALRLAISRASLVITTGGLGGAADDFTRKAVSRAAGRRLILSETVLRHIEGEPDGKGTGTESVRDRKALIPARARILFGAKGAGFGFAVHVQNAYVVCLPGHPARLKAILATAVIPYLSDRFKRRAVAGIRSLRTTGLAESELRERLADLLSFKGSVAIRILSAGEGADIRLEAQGWSETERTGALDAVSDKIRERLGESVYGTDDETLESVVCRLLTGRAWTLAVAESCTGGLIGHRLTNVPGSSAFLDRAAVCYSNRSKVEALGVPESVLTDNGAVSAPTAAEMAAGVRRAAGTDVGLSVTGIAGPTGGTREKPVGLVYFGLSTPEGVRTDSSRFRGDREAVKAQASQRALDLLRRYLLSPG